jgi:hypothetical protein
VDSFEKILLAIVLVVTGVVGGYALVHFTWRIISVIRLRRQATHFPRGRPVLWRDPGEIEKLDLFHGAGGELGKPLAPFHFLKEHSSGSNPCVSVGDAKRHIWRIKWGIEVNTENFCTRIAWACGYFVETTYFLAEGKIEDVPTELDRARKCIDEHGNFQNARFELDDQHVKKYFDEKGWAWNENPFVGTRELNGLKILFMLLSNWDNKDIRDVARGSNTAMFEYTAPDKSKETRYLIIDWGGAMGKWGSNIVSRGTWDCAGFESQNSDFLRQNPDGSLEWGYQGQRTEDISRGITVEDVQWFCSYAGCITNAQILDALHASGASVEEAQCFARALRERIDKLRRVQSVQDVKSVKSV